MAEKNKNNNSLVFADNGYLSYIDFSKLSFADKLRRRLNIAKAQFDNGSLAKAGYALIGGYDPENPRLSTGEVPNPGMRNPKQVIGTVLKAKSIAERSAKISNKIWDKQYLKAINSGNPKRILVVRDLHFKAKSGVNNPYMFLHATDAKFNQFDVDRTGQNFISDLSLRNGKGIYLTLYSKDYEGTPEIIAKSPDLYGNNVMPLRAYFRNPEKTEYTYHIISSPNYDGYIYSGKDIIGEAFIRNPKLLKSAYSITYDDAGNIIPISLRDNFLINDIRYKQGGKMNILEFLKNGSGIHIKEKNKGKFTKSAKAAGLTVQEHARSVLNDPNATPLLKKRANFARNAAKWKHKEGGKAFVTGINVLDSNPKAYKEVKKKYKMRSALQGTKMNFFLKANNFLNSDLGKGLSSSLINGIGNIVSSTKATKAINAQNEALDTLLKAHKTKTFVEKYNENLQNLTDKSSIVRQSNAWNLANSLVSSENDFEKEINRQKLINEESAKQALADAWYTTASNIAGTAINALNKNGVPKTVSSPSYFDNYVNTKYKKFGTFNPDGSMNMFGGTFTIKDGYKPNQPQLFNYQPLKLNV